MGMEMPEKTMPKNAAGTAGNIPPRGGRWPLLFPILLAAVLACSLTNPVPPSPSVFDRGRTVYGFFPTPPEANLLSMFAVFRSIAAHGDVALLQTNVPWDEFRDGSDSPSPKFDDLRNQVTLAWANGIEPIFVVDPLNGLNRTQFAGLPEDLAGAGFSNPAVRAACRNFALRIARAFHPRYLGLASEINTYADAFPGDFPNFLSLYRETYAAVKAESPATQVFVTFQWEDLNNLGAFDDGGPPGIKWNLIEAFEPDLDLWAISTYPFVAFDSAADIPDDYYTPLLARTAKPLAVGEGGFSSVDNPPFRGTPEDQVRYLDALHAQIGSRLAFWIYLLLDDFNLNSYAEAFKTRGADAAALGLFAHVGLRTSGGTPKPALAVWDGFRK
jgi:hypothetical protein